MGLPTTLSRPELQKEAEVATADVWSGGGRQPQHRSYPPSGSCANLCCDGLARPRGNKCLAAPQPPPPRMLGTWDNFTEATTWCCSLGRRRCLQAATPMQLRPSSARQCLRPCAAARCLTARRNEGNCDCHQLTPVLLYPLRPVNAPSAVTSGRSPPKCTAPATSSRPTPRCAVVAQAG